jgi:fructose-1,6-bisphosphatase I
LLYECNPIAFLAEQAGGAASNGTKRVMEVEPKELHQRTPFYCGNIGMVQRTESFLREN